MSDANTPQGGETWRNKETGDLVEVKQIVNIKREGTCVVFHSKSGSVHNYTRRIDEFCDMFEKVAE